MISIFGLVRDAADAGGPGRRVSVLSLSGIYRCWKAANPCPRLSFGETLASPIVRGCDYRLGRRCF